VGPDPPGYRRRVPARDGQRALRRRVDDARRARAEGQGLRCGPRALRRVHTRIGRVVLPGPGRHHPPSGA
jgi:hypothetical protein